MQWMNDLLVSRLTVMSSNIYSSIKGLKKEIPDAPKDQVPVHLRPKQKYATYPGPQW